MPLSDSVLSGMIQANLIAAKGTPLAPADLAAFADAVAKAVVDHIKASAAVVVAGGSSAGSYTVS